MLTRVENEIRLLFELGDGQVDDETSLSDVHFSFRFESGPKNPVFDLFLMAHVINYFK